jgi:acetyl-CoA carboxylase biotin carboxylase subunit
LAKLIAKGPSRPEAIKTMERALWEFHISGIDTTIPFYREIMKNERYRRGKISTNWIENTFLPLPADNRG